MIDEREELDRIIVSKVNEGEVHDAADAILAAGYRKTGNSTMTPDRTVMNISDEAIEAAAESLSAQMTCDGQPHVTDFMRTCARDALNAAAPFMEPQP